MTRYHLTIADDAGPVSRIVDIHRVYNLGSAARSPDSALPHQREVAEIGVRIAFDVPPPRIYPVSPQTVTTEHAVYVLNDETSGEVEFCVLVDGDEVFVGVGSDHTDRLLERTSIPWSKEVCPNVLAPTMWRWPQVREHWDECLLESRLDGALYQSSTVGVFLRPEDMIELIRMRAGAGSGPFLIYSGAYASIDTTMRYGVRWDLTLTDTTLRRTITHQYDVVNLRAEIRDEYRVPLTLDT